MPLGDGITFKYGEYVFDPRPLFTINKEILKTVANTGLGTKYSLTLDGHILPTGIDPIGGNVGGLTKVFNGVADLRTAFDKDFKLLFLQCNTNDPIISGYPKVLSIDINNADDNYIRRADYTISLELPSLTGPSSEAAGIDCDGTTIGDLGGSGLISITDEFTVEFLDEKVGGDISIEAFGAIPTVFSIQRTLSAQGDSISCAGSPYIQPYERAKSYVSANLGITPDMTGLVGLMCVGADGQTFSNNFRSISVNQSEGSVNATETWITFTGGNPATEDFEVTIDKAADNALTTITINGTIQGFSTINYDDCPPSGAPKFNAALASWSGVEGLLAGRASSVYNSVGGNWSGGLNAAPLSESIGYNVIGGTVTYNKSYDDRPANCYSGALQESITFNFNQPSDIFASLTVLGKPRGPLFQAISTTSATTRDISIDAIIPLVGDCAHADFNHPPDVYDQMVNSYEVTLRNEFNQVFVSSHSIGWEPKVGHFTLSKSWTVGYCY
jgi:hypothetical protein